MSKATQDNYVRAVRKISEHFNKLHIKSLKTSSSPHPNRQYRQSSPATQCQTWQGPICSLAPKDATHASRILENTSQQSIALSRTRQKRNIHAGSHRTADKKQYSDRVQG